MKDWRELQYSNTFKDMVDYFNINTNNSKDIDKTVGLILSNGVFYTGLETVGNIKVYPLANIGLSGVVESDTILDNITLYFRDTNNIVKLNKFPVDLLSYANGKPQFLFIKEDLSYRISDFMYGEADEILLLKFIINTDVTWNQCYFLAQRAGTPMYNSEDEFYQVEGMYVKSPGDLELSQTSGTVKRSGIDFTDKVSPDISTFYNVTSERVPLRYINTYNEIDYSQQPTYNVITDRYMTYNTDSKKITEVEEKILQIRNLYYMFDNYSNGVADELHHSIITGVELADLKQMVNSYVNSVEVIYREVDKLYTLLGDNLFTNVRRAVLNNNEIEVNNFIYTYLAPSVIVSSVSEIQVTAIRTLPEYILDINAQIESLELALNSVQDEVSSIVVSAGTLSPVPSGKFTIQRVLWDIYENVLILQYGNVVYNSFNEAIEGTSLLDFPAPYSKTMFIPLAILVIKSGATSINNDSDCLIIDRRWIIVDQETDSYSDYIARSRINKIISGDIPAGKANLLKRTDNGVVVYSDGDYYLTYDNLTGRVQVINNTTSSTYNSKEALSAYQGYLLNNKFGDYLPLAGGIMTGTLSSQSIVPRSTQAYDIGTNQLFYNNGYIVNLFKAANIPYVGSSSGITDLKVEQNSQSPTVNNNQILFLWE